MAATSESDPQTTVTSVLAAAGTVDDREILDRLVPLVYQELRSIAHAFLARERHRRTLQTTVLVHEAYLKLIDEKNVPIRNRAYFFAASARAMRQILVDTARRRNRLKRGSGQEPEPIPELAIDPSAARFAGDLLEIHEALGRLERDFPRPAAVVECRYFGGLSVEETAAALGCSDRSVKRDWAFARAWLYRELGGERSG